MLKVTAGFFKRFAFHKNVPAVCSPQFSSHRHTHITLCQMCIAPRSSTCKYRQHCNKVQASVTFNTHSVHACCKTVVSAYKVDCWRHVRIGGTKSTQSTGLVGFLCNVLSKKVYIEKVVRGVVYCNMKNYDIWLKLSFIGVVK